VVAEPCGQISGATFTGTVDNKQETLEIYPKFDLAASGTWKVRMRAANYP
jgi:hypothetical protein